MRNVNSQKNKNNLAKKKFLVFCLPTRKMNLKKTILEKKMSINCNSQFASSLRIRKNSSLSGFAKYFLFLVFKFNLMSGIIN